MSDEKNITNCFYKEDETGKLIKSTKKKYTWQFTEGQNTHKIELFDSKLTGKKRIEADGKIVFPAQSVSSLFSHAFHLGNNNIAIVQNGSTFECRINNLPFSHYLNLQKNISQFEGGKQSEAVSNVNKTEVKSGFAIKENSASKQGGQFGFKIKPFGSTEQSKQEGEDSENAANRFGNMENYFNKIGHHSEIKKENDLNLLDIDAIKGTKKINVLEISPLPSPSNFNDSVKNFQKSNNQNLNTNSNMNTFNEQPKEKEQAPQGINDLNSIFDNFKVTEKPQPKEENPLDKLKEVYNKSYGIEKKPIEKPQPRPQAEPKKDGLIDFTPATSLQDNYHLSFLGQLRNSNIPKTAIDNVPNFSQSQNKKAFSNNSLIPDNGGESKILSYSSITDSSKGLENKEDKENINIANIGKSQLGQNYPTFEDVDHSKFQKKAEVSEATEPISEVVQPQKNTDDVFGLFN